MAKRIAVMTIHGMGDTDRSYAEPLIKKLNSRLDPEAQAEIHYGKIYYQDILQENQETLFENSRSQIDQKALRKFLLFGISDAAGLEYSRTKQEGVYKESQKRIFDGLGEAFTAADGVQIPVILVAQSLGGQVISNYIWDANKQGPTWGIWRDDHSSIPAADLNFRRLKTARTLFTTGCNIPIFVGGLDRANITPIDKPNPGFEWKNYFDEDDVLGWPLQPLSNPYDLLVEDIPINAGRLWESWNPLSHTRYWEDNDFVKPLARHIQAVLQE